MRHAVVDADCNVVNVVELADGAEWTPPGGCTVRASESAIIGGTFDGVAFFPPLEAAQPPRRRLVPRSLIVDRLAAAGFWGGGFFPRRSKHHNRRAVASCPDHSSSIGWRRRGNLQWPARHLTLPTFTRGSAGTPAPRSMPTTRPRLRCCKRSAPIRT